VVGNAGDDLSLLYGKRVLDAGIMGMLLGEYLEAADNSKVRSDRLSRQ